MLTAHTQASRRFFFRLALALFVLNAAGLWLNARPGAQEATGPRAVRNDVARPWPEEEVMMLRHQRLLRGSHQAYYQASRAGVWPWFEKIGTRIVGQWQVVYPDGQPPAGEEYIGGWRLARYASYEHWEATRQGVALGGNGGDWDKNRESGRIRRQFQQGSDAAHFLQGRMHDSQPIHIPSVDETYVPADGAGSDIVAVRNDAAQPGDEIVTLRYWKIDKGSFDQFLRTSIDRVWPYYEKVGARIIGQWQVIYPERATDVESPDYDEVFMMTRYASHAHWAATRPGVVDGVGGNGPDWDAMIEGVRLRQALTQETTVEFLEGYLYQSTPVFLPGMGERFRMAN